MVTPRLHKHAGLMRLWLADNSIEIEKLTLDSNNWCPEPYPGWQDYVEYRIKPSTITIGNVAIPEPLRIAPVIGTTVWVVDLVHGSVRRTWRDSIDHSLMKQGLVHLTEDAANAHANALISLTERK